MDKLLTETQDIKPKLFLDYDCTLVNTIQCICKLYDEDFKYYSDWKPSKWWEINTWDFSELNCTDKKYIDTYFNTQRFFDNVEYMDNASNVLEVLKDFYHIIVVSTGYSPNLRAKKVWIKKNVPYAEFIGVNLKQYKDKSHIDMSGKGNILLDDRADNLLTSNVERPILFGDNYPWNMNWDGERLFNWWEVKKTLLQEVV